MVEAFRLPILPFILSPHPVDFPAAPADLHNLAPAIGAVNAARKNYRFGMVPASKGQIRPSVFFLKAEQFPLETEPY